MNDQPLDGAGSVYHDPAPHDLLAFQGDPTPSTELSRAENNRRDLVQQIDALCGDLPYPFAIFAEDADGAVARVLGWGLDLPNGTVLTYTCDPDGHASWGSWSDADLAADLAGGHPAWLVRNRWALRRTPVH